MARIRRVKKVVEKGFRGITPSRVCPVPFKFRSFWIDGYLADAAERHISSPELSCRTSLLPFSISCYRTVDVRTLIDEIDKNETRGCNVRER